MPGNRLARKANKYRGIMIAIACFLLFDLGVLLLNFYTSYEIAEDTISINYVGRQRMRSERMLRALLQLQSEGVLYGHGKPLLDREMNTAPEAGNWLELSPREVLATTAKLFDETDATLREGGTTTGAWGETLKLRKLSTPQGIALLDKTDALWRPYRTAIKDFLQDPDATVTDMEIAVSQAQAGNVALQKVLNELAKEMESAAEEKASFLRRVQTVGIVLALLNFAFIVFKFLWQLRLQDEKITAAQQETAEILETVREGLFLLDPHYRIGNQHSASLPQVLQREVAVGTEFMPMLKEMVPASVFAAAEGYLELLFGNRVKENLVADLNPLSEVEVHVRDELGNPANRYLSFRFNRVLQSAGMPHLLVTVQDVTERVLLSRQLAEARGESRVEVDVLIRLLSAEPRALTEFIAAFEANLAQINDMLRAAGKRSEMAYLNVINHALRKIHACKGEAALLGIDLLESEAHKYESELLALRERGGLCGDDMLALTVGLTALYERVQVIKDIAEQLGEFAKRTAHSDFSDNLHSLAERIAHTQNKKIRLDAALAALNHLPTRISSDVQHIAIQLLRNAITHGIEAPDERRELAKAPTGNITLSCQPTTDGNYEFLIRDDGRGVCTERIRSSLVASGHCTEPEAAALDERQLVMKIFEPGFSTAAAAGTDAGHGAGMDVVMEKVKALGGKLRLSTRVNQFTEFRLRFSPNQGSA